MTARQRAFHVRLRAAAPGLYRDADRALSGELVGYTVRLRIPTTFSPGFSQGWWQDIDGDAIRVTRTPRGLEYVEDGGTRFHRKGCTPPRPRLLPMVSR